MKRFLQIMIALLLVSAATAAVACKTNLEEPEEKMLCGGYTQQHELSDEDIALFRAVVGEGTYTPLTVATQVVAGLNYRFCCSKSSDTKKYFITIYKPLQGDPVISSIQDENGKII